MNLIFDLQLFGNPPTIEGGFSGGSKEYSIGNVVLKSTFDGSGSKFANFTTNAIKESTIVGTWDSNPEKEGIYFNGTSNSKNATLVGILDGGVNTWNFESTIKSAVLGEDVKLNLMQAPDDGIDATLAAAAGQKITFGANAVSVNVVTVGSGNQATTGTLALKGGAGDVSLLNGSALEGSTIIGEAGGVVTLASANNAANVLNLKGSDSEAFVTVGGSNASTVDSSELSGFKSIVFSGEGQTTGGIQVSLKGGVKNSAVSILGGKGDDTILIGENVNASSQVLISGGKGDDTITLSKTGRETVILGTGHDKDSVTNWLESKGDITKGNTISLKGAIDTFNVRTVTGGYADVSVGAAGSTFTNGATIFSSAGNTGKQLGVNLITSDDTYSALLVGKAALDSTVGTKFDNFGYIIAD